MAYEIVNAIIPKSNSNRPGGKADKRYIVVHTTANRSKGANAKMHARFVRNGGGAYNVSWHYTVDDGSKIYQHLPVDEPGLHAGDGRYGKGNVHGIGIEICENSDGDFDKAVANAIEFIADLMKTHDIPLENVKPHQYFSGKTCPRPLLSQWDSFIDRVSKASGKSGGKGTITPTNGTTYTIKKGDTLYDIAKAHGTSVDKLRKANPEVDPLRLQVGSKINLDPQDIEVYTIKKGDTLWDIAKRTKGLSVGDLIQANPNIDPKRLKVGQTINIKRDPSAKKVDNKPLKPKGVKVPSGKPILKYGSRGERVRQLQRALNSIYFKVGNVDGIYGRKTQDAVKRFQSMYGALKDDGIYGKQTEAYLKRAVERGRA